MCLLAGLGRYHSADSCCFINSVLCFTADGYECGFIRWRMLGRVGRSYMYVFSKNWLRWAGKLCQCLIRAMGGCLYYCCFFVCACV